MKNVSIDVKHVTRVEGHGNMSVRVTDGEITHLELAIVESPRFFESFLRGRRYDEAPHITCRICGICSVAHTTASLLAIEDACGITPSEQTLLLRKLILHAEQIQSHVLHEYFLAVPDYLGVGSVIPLAKTHPDVVRRALRLKRLANDICCTIGGRHIHPIAMHVGGFTHVPRAQELVALKQRLIAARADLDQTVELFAELKFPDLQRETEFLSLTPRGDDEYPFYAGDLISTLDTTPTPPREYKQRVIEDVVQHSSAKHCRSPQSAAYAVGALARFNNNHSRLHPDAKAVAERLGLRAIDHNPFHNNIAQLVETVHCVEDSIRLIDVLLDRGVRIEALLEPVRFGRGVGATEAPRGILFHEFEVDSDGLIAGANLIIPTGQNLANLEADMRALVPQLLATDLGKEEMTLQLEMLIRAYDPCISCSVHFLDIEWIA